MQALFFHIFSARAFGEFPQRKSAGAVFLWDFRLAGAVACPLLTQAESQTPKRTQVIHSPLDF